ncbi:band 4.1-like protein 4 isoform X2 [Zootermopsis nevadensis]|uniref:band 4.1-like protein 4 isoform X2 n=1 Tax=Zootermopsis nevadensis TaxID=136037 RepID=UPI000B8EA4B5|nr:band 4.1-like protein 4 isoform X2 [Zootermopsis nevadensis]
MRCFCKRIRTHHVKVVLLDEQELIQEIQDNSPGQEILDTVFRHLNLLETAYFGLRYLDSSSQTHWLDPTKKITKQLKGTDPFTLYFGVKFYAADPCKLLEEITRYQFFLQVKQDILQGRLPVTFDLAAELGSYVVQSELGDYDPRRHSPGYVSEFRFISNQTVELESRIAELHKGLVGQLPAVAELSYLDKVKWLEMYGVDLHPVLGEDNVEYFLGLTPSGIIVLRNKNKVGNYYWPRITKIYFKGRYFMLRVCDKNNDENTYGFETPSKSACKHLWKCCVEHHAFFRLVQVSPTAPDIFVLGSRFSGRTEKQAQRDAQLRMRSPPQFTRTPSRRYQRRIVEGAQDAPKVEENVNNENIPPQEIKAVSIPQPAQSVGSLYRSTCSIPAVLPSHPRADSPRSTRSAPWTQPHVRGLYTSSSPRSVRSAGNNGQLLSRLTRRSSSVESQSSNDSRSCKRHRHHRSRRGSDNESELSKCSGKSHGHRRHRHRSHGNKRDSGSEQDQHHRHRHKGSGRHRHGSHYELVDSEAQWKEVQRRQAEGGTGIHQATVVTNRRSGYMNSGMETESELSYHHKRKQKKHRSRSRSPSENKPRLPDELKKHLEFDLIDTEGMSESQLREIPYKIVETNAKAMRVKMSPNNKQNHRSPRRTKSCSTQEERCPLPSSGDSPPPPYSPPQVPPAGPEVPGTPKLSSMANPGETDHQPPNIGNDNMIADVNKNSGSSSASHSPAGSVRSRNNNNNNNHVPRTSLEYASLHSQGGTRPPLPALRALGSALYDNPGTLLNGHLRQSMQQQLQQHRLNINNLKSTHLSSHEHSDSGLSAESHEYSPYNSERLSEGPRYAQTTKLSSLQPPLPSLVSTTASNSHVGVTVQPRSYPFSSMRVTSTHITPDPDTVHRLWNDQRARGKLSGRLVAGASNDGGGLAWMSPGAPPLGTYRTLPNSTTPTDANINNNWSGSIRSTRSGDGGTRRGPLYFRGHQPNTSGILRDSNKFNTSTVIGSCWTNDTATIREDDESQDPVQFSSPIRKAASSSDGTRLATNATHRTSTSNGVQEVTHEMSTEL